MQPSNETHKKIFRVRMAKQLLETTHSLDDVYTLLNQLSSDVLDLYPHIACRSQCNTCCKGTSMPTVSPAEWEMVHDYLLRFYTPEQRQALIERTRQVYNPHKEAFWSLHDTIRQPSGMHKLEAFARLLMTLENTQCPMLVDEKCSVYMSRPARCRAHGAFLFVLEEHTQIHACQSEVEKMDDYLAKQGSRNVTMPVWNPFESKIMDAYNQPGAVQTLLPIWLLCHVEQGELIEQTQLKPDFEAYRLKEL